MVECFPMSCWPWQSLPRLISPVALGSSQGVYATISYASEDGQTQNACHLEIKKTKTRVTCQCVCAICSFVCLWWGSYTWKCLGKISDKFEQINIAMLTNWVVILGWETFDLHRIFEGHQSDPLGTTKRCLVCNSVDLIKKNKQISYRSRDIAAISLSVYNETFFVWKLTCLLRKVRNMIQFADIIIFPNGLANKPHHLAYIIQRGITSLFLKPTFPRYGDEKKTSKANDGSLFPMGAMKIIALRKMDLLWHSAIWKGFPTPRSWGLT